MCATECCSCMSQRGVDQDVCPNPKDGGCTSSQGKQGVRPFSHLVTLIRTRVLHAPTMPLSFPLSLSFSVPVSLSPHSCFVSSFTRVNAMLTRTIPPTILCVLASFHAKVFYNNNIGKCTSEQVIESDELEYAE